ncbi:hypothetical protein SANA_29520 [Gottschalkiaceae bacterium SANA]|nr:hypothetical protein SANA_29520 [Gottschalkiaceae bacterium SANA]
MAKTFRNSKAIKFIDKLRQLRQAELKHSLILGNHLQEQFQELFENSDSNEPIDLYGLIDAITNHSYKEDGLSFSHSQFSFFHETMYHFGCTGAIETVIKEMGDFFDLDIPERTTGKSALENYQIKLIDTNDYSTTPREFYLIIGGMDESYPEEVRKEIAQHCTEVFLNFFEADTVSQTDNGFIIQTALQNIPTISMELNNRNIAIYGMIPIETKDKN